VNSHELRSALLRADTEGNRDALEATPAREVFIEMKTTDFLIASVRVEDNNIVITAGEVV
jgi:hypothetical protein